MSKAPRENRRRLSAPASLAATPAAKSPELRRQVRREERRAVRAAAVRAPERPLFTALVNLLELDSLFGRLPAAEFAEKESVARRHWETLPARQKELVRGLSIALDDEFADYEDRLDSVDADDDGGDQGEDDEEFEPEFDLENSSTAAPAAEDDVATETRASHDKRERIDALFSDPDFLSRLRDALVSIL